MRMTFLLAVVGIALRLEPAAEPVILKQQVYPGMCSASAGAALDQDYFVVADDESNVLRIYSLAQAGPPVELVPLSTFLKVDPKNPETDMEGAAKIGDRIFWITSHGRNKKGKARESRQRFFCTRILPGSPPKVIPEGRFYQHLLRDLIAETAFAKYNLRQATSLAPKEQGGFNIEGLSAAPDGPVWIGLRNPVHGGKAIMIPLLNPEQLIQGGHTARFGPPTEVDLGGNGIRDILFRGNGYLLLAGSYKAGGASELYSLPEGQGPFRVMRWPPGTLNPEAILELPEQKDTFLILSDEGSQEREGGRECKDLPPQAQSFRALFLKLE